MSLWEAAAILGEEKVQKENGYQAVSDDTFLKPYSFISGTGSYSCPKPGSLIEVHKSVRWELIPGWDPFLLEYTFHSHYYFLIIF